MLIPPEVIIASSIGLNPDIVISKCFNICISFILSFFVISLTFLFSSISESSITVSIIFLGNKSFRLFLKDLFFSFSKSLNILKLSFSSSNAGFKSIINFIVPLFNNSSTFLYLNKCAELLNIVGPETPKCVNRSSPKSSYIVLFLELSISFIFIFLKDKPCICLQIFKFLSFVCNGTSEGLILTILCPKSSAILYPSPVEPVAE